VAHSRKGTKLKEDDIHQAVREKFGTNARHDERFSDKTYWTWVESQMRPDTENPEAMDNLPESASPYTEEISREGRIRLRAIREAWPMLSRRQQQVVWLCGVKEMSIQEAAETIGKTKAAAQGLLNRARKRIKRVYETRIDEEA
jgi:DNA-directed RNA polymerase specialized sigma24 family protein